MSTLVGAPLLDHFAALPDPRQQAKVLYPLPEILLLVLSATVRWCIPAAPARRSARPNGLAVRDAPRLGSVPANAAWRS